jgi:hypothetical protein
MKRASRVAAGALALWIGVTTLLAQEERIVSKYTSTARAKALSFVESSGQEDEGFRAVFPGLGGYQLEHLGGDLRSWINVRFGKQTVDLYAATMEAAGGTFPHKANDVVEWRGIEKQGRFTPYAIIYRIASGNDETRKTRTRLIVIKLDGPRSAVVGYAEGRNEDAEAKAIADRSRLAR